MEWGPGTHDFSTEPAAVVNGPESCRVEDSGRLAQLVRAPCSHRGGHRFEPCAAHLAFLSYCAVLGWAVPTFFVCRCGRSPPYTFVMRRMHSEAHDLPDEWTVSFRYSCRVICFRWKLSLGRNYKRPKIDVSLDLPLA